MQHEPSEIEEVAAGLWRAVTGTVVPLSAPHEAPAVVPLTTFLVLRAFSNGCTAMTGVEAP